LGWALFCDCDFLFLDDIAKLNEYLDPSKAVLCVKHDYTPKATVKMDGKVQTNYPRKNWSSFMLFNCEHPSTKTLTPDVINSQTGAYLHRMQWAADAMGC
jgi:lipopolysaccharide biosynthesis glycosyltransferase